MIAATLPHRVPPSEEALRRRLGSLELEEGSLDSYIRQTQDEITRRDKRARTWVRCTDFAGNAVKPLAVASLVGMGFNPLWGLGLLGSIGVLAAAFAFRSKLYEENRRLVQAQGQLDGLTAAASRLRQEKEPLQRQIQEIEWIKKAADVSGTLSGRREEIRVEDGAVVIGGVRLGIAATPRDVK